MTTIDRLLISVLVTVVAATSAMRVAQDQRLTDPQVVDAVVVRLHEVPAVVDPAPKFEFTGFDSATEELIRDSIELYEEAGLSLPSIRFVNCADPDDCFGRRGVAVHHSEGPEIRICGDEISPWLEWVVIHELAHCWDRNQLTQEARDEFLDLRGLETWRDGTWHERGAEHAAEIMVWGLIDRPVRPGHIDQNSCAELLAGYTTLTGQPPLHGYCDICP